MPGPDPSAVWFEQNNGQTSVYYLPYFWTRNAGNRKARAMSILKRMAQGDWYCLWCGDELPYWRRADARYCCVGCRKRAARKRRTLRSETGT